MTLYCNATGNPSPQTAWIKSGKVLVTDSVHVMRGINRSQAGIYQCMAWNGIMRNETSNCTIDVYCKFIEYLEFNTRVYFCTYTLLNVKVLPVYNNSFVI